MVAIQDITVLHDAPIFCATCTEPWTGWIINTLFQGEDQTALVLFSEMTTCAVDEILGDLFCMMHHLPLSNDFQPVAVQWIQVCSSKLACSLRVIHVFFLFVCFFLTHWEFGYNFNSLKPIVYFLLTATFRHPWLILPSILCPFIILVITGSDAFVPQQKFQVMIQRPGRTMVTDTWQRGVLHTRWQRLSTEPSDCQLAVNQRLEQVTSALQNGKSK